MELCEWLLIIQGADPAFTKFLWIEEATYKTSERENHYSCVSGVKSTLSK
jgi:hypothetical protein